MCDDEGGDLAVLGLELMQDCQYKDRGLAHARFGLTKHVLSLQRYWNALLLDCTRHGV